MKRPPRHSPPAGRNDGPYENAFLGVGGRRDRTARTSITQGRFLVIQELTNLYASDGLARKVIDAPAEEMTRAGYCIEGVEIEEDIRSDLEGIKAGPMLTDALRWAGLFGGSVVVMLVNDGGQLEDPLNENNIKGIEQLRVYDRWHVQRVEKYTDPMDRRFGGTKTWLIQPAEGAPYRVHESRVLVFDGETVPEDVRLRNDGWGDSRLQSCFDQLVRAGMSHVWANGLLERAQQAVHSIPDLTGILRAPGGEDLVIRRINMVDMARSVNNTVVIDSNESYELKSTPFSGVSDLLDRIGLALSAVSGIPESLLFGRQQGGLNSTGKGDLENWYAKVGQMQQTRLLPQIDRLCRIAMLARKIKPVDYLIKFNPLWLPSEKEQSETAYRRAQTFEILNNIGAIDATEIRAMLPAEGYQLDDVEVMPESEPVDDDPITPTEPEKDELKEAQIDLIRAQAERLRKSEPAPRADQAPQPHRIDVNLGGVSLELPTGAIQIDNHLPTISTPEIRVDVQVPAQPAPVVNVEPTAIVRVDAPAVTVENHVAPASVIVETPLKTITTVVTRDADGEMTGSVATEALK